MISYYRPKLWNYCNVLRDDGINYGDFPSTWHRTGSKQLTYLLFLKIVAEQWQGLNR